MDELEYFGDQTYENVDPTFDQNTSGPYAGFFHWGWGQ
jgi:hypothetical protein